MPISLANRVLDSLEARGDWQRMYIIRNVQYNNCQTYQSSMDSLSRIQLAVCDSTVRNGFTRRREDATTIQGLQNKKKQVPLKMGALALVALILGLLIH